MRTLERISVSGFKTIRELKDFELRQLNVMIGANGAGKSNFLKLFEFLYQVTSTRLTNYTFQSGGCDSFLHFGQKVTSSSSFSLRFNDQNFLSGYELEVSPSAIGSLFVSHETYWADDKSKAQQPEMRATNNGLQESFLFTETQATGVAKTIYNDLQHTRAYHFNDTSQSAHLKQIGDIGDNGTLRPDASNLAAFLYLLQNRFQKNYRSIVETVRLVAPFFDDFVLRPLPENSNKIRLQWRDKSSDDYLDASYFSDGTLRFICLATLLLQPILPFLLIVDEPELGLHPSAINLLAELLVSTATKTQVLVSTQSVSLVDQFQPENIIVVDRENGSSTFNRLNAEELTDWLNEYSLGELWEKNIFGGRP